MNLIDLLSKRLLHAKAYASPLLIVFTPRTLFTCQLKLCIWNGVFCVFILLLLYGIFAKYVSIFGKDGGTLCFLIGTLIEYVLYQ